MLLLPKAFCSAQAKVSTATISSIIGNRIVLIMEAGPEIRGGTELVLFRGAVRVARIRVRSRTEEAISADLLEQNGDAFAAVGDEVEVRGLPAAGTITRTPPAAQPPTTPATKARSEIKKTSGFPNPRVKLPSLPPQERTEALAHEASPSLTISRITATEEQGRTHTSIELAVSDTTPLRSGEALVVLTASGVAKGLLRVRDTGPGFARASVAKETDADSLAVGDKVARTSKSADRSVTPAAVDSARLTSLREALVTRGYENVTVASDAKTGEVRVEYENRLMRWSVTALGEVLAMVARSLPDDTPIRVVPKRVDVPIMSLAFRARDYREFLEGTLSRKDLRTALALTEDVPKSSRPFGAPASQSRPTNPSAGRLDVTAAPGLRVRFGTRSERDAQFVPGAELTLARGLSAQARATFSSEQKQQSILSMAKATETLRMNGNTFLSLSGGRFNSTFEGGLLEIGRHSNDGRHSFFADFARTSDFTVSAPSGNSALLNYRYHLGYIDASVMGTVGQFLRGDKGGRVELVSTFRERDIGLFYSNTQTITEFGFLFRIPLSSQQYSRPAPVRFHVRDAFPFRFSTPATGGAELLDSPALEQQDRLSPARVWMQLDSLQKAGQPWMQNARLSGRNARSSGASTADSDISLDTSRLEAAPPIRFPGSQISLSGMTGLVNIPAAEVLPYGSYAFGINAASDRLRGSSSPVPVSSVANFITIGLLPNLEASIRLTNRLGHFGFHADSIGGIGDRMFSMQWRLQSEGHTAPALVVGAQDILSGKDFNLLGVARFYPARFVAASKHVGMWGDVQKVRATAGYGTHRLGGVFLGLDGHLLLSHRALTQAQWMFEYDTTHVNLGARWPIPFLPYFSVDTDLMGMRHFGIGIGYSRPF